jgi:hypothetical protein
MSKAFCWTRSKRGECKHTLLPRHMNAWQDSEHNFENVVQFGYLGTIVTNQILIQEEMKRRLDSGNTCLHSIQNLSSSLLLSKNVKMRIHKTIILPVVVYRYENRSLILR